MILILVYIVGVLDDDASKIKHVIDYQIKIILRFTNYKKNSKSLEQ
jgi:hypothetical protein